MRISVIGCGYLGAVHATSMASLGHDVIAVDVDADKIDALSRGTAPFFEPEFPDYLTQTLAAGKVHFTTDIRAAADCQVHFICVGTPQRADGNAADLSYVEAALDALLPLLKPREDGPVLVVGKSTVPVGTAAGIASRVEAALPDGAGALVWNPEFLREGFAVQDTLRPDRIVYGLPEGHLGAAARSHMDEVYRDILDYGTPVIATDYATAELVKVAANSFLATKISFINAMAQVCDAAGGDVTQLAEAIGYDERIGAKFLRAGVGFGGGCLPKDIRAFTARAEELGAGGSVRFLREVDAINISCREQVVEDVVAACDGDVTGKRVAILGASFKPNCDDLRDSPAIAVASALHQAGATVTITDPAALDNVHRRYPELPTAPTAFEAAAGADAVVLLTEWADFVKIDPFALLDHVANPVIIDGRNVLNAEKWRAAGWTYRGFGRP